MKKRVLRALGKIFTHEPKVESVEKTCGKHSKA